MTEEPQKPEEKKEDTKVQTMELMDLLDSLDGVAVPHLKAIPEKPTGLVETPSFMQMDNIDPSILPSTDIPSYPIDNSLENASLAPDTINLSPMEDQTQIAQPIDVIPPVEEVLPKIPDNFLETENPTGEIFKDMQIFFKQLGRAFTKRYELWEQTDSSILKILRKMQQNLQHNTEQLVETIEALHTKIKKGLKEFVQKRNEVERYAEADFNVVAKNLRKTLELLNFQIREFKLQKLVGELYDIYT
jgi:hypothetical protein